MYKPTYKFAIFDMDGTLLDTMYAHRTSVVQYLRDYNLNELADNLQDEFMYMANDEAMEAARPYCELYNIPMITMDDLHKIMLRTYQSPKKKPGVPEFLEYLKQRGVKMCVLSSNAQASAEQAIKNAGLDSYFEFVLTDEEFPKGKFDSEIFEAALERLGADIEETAVFEDALYSIKTAKSMGLHIVGIADDFNVKNREQMMKLSDEFFEEYPKVN